MSNGHASESERREIRGLEGAVRSRFVSPDSLDLAQLYYDPLHAYEEANAICDVILVLDPDNPRAKLLRAYGSIHYDMDEAHVGRSVVQLREVVDADGEYVAAACMLLAEAGSDLGTMALEEQVAFLERSVALEGAWVSNRIRLASRLSEVGRRSEAWRLLDTALDNLLDPDTPRSLVETSFHDLFTGRLMSRQDLVETMSRYTEPDVPLE